MNAFTKWIHVLTAAIAAAGGVPVKAAETNAAPERIGIYDSRLIAYAHFWSETHQQKLRNLTDEARQARSSGDSTRFRTLKAGIEKEQEQNHLQVFSTAPIDGILTAMSNRVSEVQRTHQTSRIISKWDTQAVKQFRKAQQVDLTDALLRDFTLTEKQRKVIEDLRRQKPLPLDKAKRLVRDGRL